MDNNSYQHAENTFKAIETILDSRLSLLKGDQTIVATVLQQDSVNKQKYLLSNAGMKFWAYTEDEEKIYTKNSSVYVLVPNGEFTLKKLIISQVPVEASKKTYGITNRFNQFIKVAKIASVKWSEIANGDLIRTTQSFFYNSNYDAIGITLTPNKDCNLTAADSFSIGIKFSSLTPEAAEPTIYNDDPIVISNLDLRGNPYNLSPSISYSFVYSCPELLLKNLIDLNYLLILKNYSENIDIDFIIDIWIGYTTDNLLVNTNQLKIYSNKDPNYNELANMTKALQEKYDKALAEINNSSKTKEDKAEEIKVQQEELIKALKEVNMTPRITYDKSSPDIKLYLEAFGTEDSNLVASPYIPSDNFTTIDVYRYRIGTSSEKLGTNWERVGNYTKGLVSLVYSNSSWIALGKIDFSSADAGVFFTDAETTRFKIVCKVNDDTEFISSELIYYNANKDIPAAKVVTELLRLSLQDGDTGIYNLYGLDNHLKNRATRSYSIRALTASGESLMNSDGKTYNDKLGVTKIEWIYPTYLTGIELKYKYDIDGNKTDIPEGALENGGWGDTFYYLLKSECYSNYTNNTINCIVTYKDGSTKEGSISLEFGGYGNRSTPYSLNIDINKPYRYITPGERVKLIATLERTDGVATALSQYDLVWTWVGEYDKDKEIMPVCHFVNGDGAILGDGISYSATSDEEIYVLIPEEPAAADYNAVVQLTVPKVQVNDVSEQDIVAYLPLPLCMDTDTNNKYLYQGPDRVVYDGINESSYDDSTIALYLNGQAIEIGDMAIIDDEKEISEIYVSNDIIKNNTSHLLSYVSSKEEEQTPNNVKLIAAPGTLINNKPFVNTIVILDSEENILWEQPIITFRNMWESSIYNWSGESPFTDDTGMYSPFIAAGKKESDNTFTGVMLGGVEAKASGNKTYGIFGTKLGKPRFYFTENGEAYIGNSDKLYGITLNSDGELEMILDLFYLNVPHMIVDSEKERIDIYSDNDNTVLRTRLGYIKSNTYGLDIYDGAFRLYDDQGIEMLWTDTVNDLLTLKINGWLERTEPDYTVSYTISDGTKTQTIKNSTTLKLKSETINLGHITNNITENWISGIIQTSNITYSIHNTGSSGTKLNTYTQGFLGGKVSGSYGDSATAPAGYCQLLSSSYENFYYIGANGKNHSSLGVILNLSASVGNLAFSFFDGFSGSGQANNAEIILWSRRNSGNTAPGVFVVGTFYDGSSDRRLKHSIETFPNKYELFFNSLQPKRFKYKREGENAKYYNGFIALEIIQAWEKTTGLLEKDCSLIGISPPNALGESYYYLARDEFIALNTWQIQKLKARVTELENEIKELKQNEI